MDREAKCKCRGKFPWTALGMRRGGITRNYRLTADQSATHQVSAKQGQRFDCCQVDSPDEIPGLSTEQSVPPLSVMSENEDRTAQSPFRELSRDTSKETCNWKVRYVCCAWRIMGTVFGYYIRISGVFADGFRRKFAKLPLIVLCKSSHMGKAPLLGDFRDGFSVCVCRKDGSDAF